MEDKAILRIVFKDNTFLELEHQNYNKNLNIIYTREEHLIDFFSRTIMDNIIWFNVDSILFYKNKEDKNPTNIFYYLCKNSLEYEKLKSSLYYFTTSNLFKFFSIFNDKFKFFKTRILEILK